MDLRHAFDSVQYSNLLDVLQKNELSEHCTKVIMSMYKSVKVFVKMYQETTDEFDCEKSLRQGYILSPTLFSIFTNEIANKIEEIW